METHRQTSLKMNWRSSTGQIQYMELNSLQCLRFCVVEVGQGRQIHRNCQVPCAAVASAVARKLRHNFTLSHSERRAQSSRGGGVQGARKRLIVLAMSLGAHVVVLGALVTQRHALSPATR